MRSNHSKFESAYNDAMTSPCASFWTRKIINEGLTKDCVDAVAHLEHALEVLKLKRDACLAVLEG